MTNHTTMKEPYNQKEVTFHLPWGKLAGKLWTGREGPKVLCLHGMFSNASCYDKLIPLMLERVGGSWCSVDLPGSGRSDRHPPGIVVEMLQLTHDLQRVVGELSWKTLHLIAHSASSSMAFYLAALIPAVIESVVSVDVVVYNLLLENSFWPERAQVLLEKCLPVHRPRVYTRDGALDRMQSSRVSEVSRESLETLLSRSAISVPGGYVLNNDPRFFNACMYSTMTARMHQELLREMRCPTLLILHGQSYIADTPQYKVTFDTLKEHLGHRLDIVTINGSHDMIMEDPGPIADTLQQHFTRLSAKL